MQVKRGYVFSRDGDKRKCFTGLPLRIRHSGVFCNVFNATYVSLLLLYTKLARFDFESERRDSLLYPAFSLQTENRAVKCPGYPFLNFLDPPLKRQSRCSEKFSRAVHHLRFRL